MAKKRSDLLSRYALLKALKTILSSPARNFSIRELAKEARISPSASKASCDYLLSEGIVSDKGSVGRASQLSANLESVLAKQWKILFSLQSIENAGLMRAALEKIPNPVCILLYGSVAKGTDDSKSDVDLLAISHSRKRASIRLIKDALGRDVNLLVMTPSEWREVARKNKVFYDQVISDSIILYGKKPVVL